MKNTDSDPFLLDCLRALLNQNYPQYELRVIVDNREDPAWEIATQMVPNQAQTHIQVNSLIIPREACSLKYSFLLLRSRKY